MEMNTPEINWIKFDENKHKYFNDGDVFLCAFYVENRKTNLCRWEYDVVVINCDDESFSLNYTNGEYFDSWHFSDCDYFHIIEGSEPTEAL